MKKHLDNGTVFHFDESHERVAVERRQDVEPILNNIEALRADGGGKSKTGEIYHAARIPLVIVEQYCNQKGITYAEFLKGKHVLNLLRDPSLKAFRIWEGRV